MDSGDDRYSEASVGRDWTLISGRASALIDTLSHEDRLVVRRSGALETIAARMLARDGIEAIWQLHLRVRRRTGEGICSRLSLWSG